MLVFRGGLYVNKLTIFIPTYRRAKSLNNLLKSIFYDNQKYCSLIDVVISSNNKKTLSSKSMPALLLKEIVLI